MSGDYANLPQSDYTSSIQVEVFYRAGLYWPPTKWTKRTVDGIRGGGPERPIKPLWTDPEPVQVGRWDDVEGI
jgi:hypothetical protein